MDNYDIGNLKEHYEKMSKDEKAVRLAAFYIILEGTGADINELCKKTFLTSEQVKTIVLKLESQGALVADESLTVVGSHGLSVIPTPHNLHINGINLYAWCAADAIGIPAALEADARITSNCAHCSKPLVIEMVKGKIAYCSNPDIRLWVVEADLGRPISGCT